MNALKNLHGNLGSLTSQFTGGPTSQVSADGLYTIEGTPPNETIKYTEKNTEHYKEYINYRLEEIYIKPLEDLGEEFENVICKNIDSYLEQFEGSVSHFLIQYFEKTLAKCISTPLTQTGGPQTGGSSPTVAKKGDVIEAVKLLIEGEVSSGVITKNTSVMDMSNIFFEKIREKMELYFKKDELEKQIREKLGRQKMLFQQYFEEKNPNMKGGVGNGSLPRFNSLPDLTKIPDLTKKLEKNQEILRSLSSSNIPIKASSISSIPSFSSMSSKASSISSIPSFSSMSSKASSISSIPSMSSIASNGTSNTSNAPETQPPTTSTEDDNLKNLPDVYLNDPNRLDPEIRAYIAEKIFEKLEEKFKKCGNLIKQKLARLFLDKMKKYILSNNVMNKFFEDKIHKKLFDLAISTKDAPPSQLKYLYSILFDEKRIDERRVEQIVSRLNTQITKFDMNKPEEPFVRLELSGLSDIQKNIHLLFFDPSMVDITPSLDNLDSITNVPDLTITSKYKDDMQYEAVRNILDFAYNEDLNKLVLFNNKDKSVKKMDNTTPVTTIYDIVIQLFEGMLSDTKGEFEKIMEDAFKEYVHILYKNFEENKVSRYYDLILSNISVVNFLQAVVLDCIDKHKKLHGDKPLEYEKFIVFIIYGIYYSIHKYIKNSYELIPKENGETPLIQDSHVFYSEEWNQPTFYVNIDRIYDEIQGADWKHFIEVFLSKFVENPAESQNYQSYYDFINSYINPEKMEPADAVADATIPNKGTENTVDKIPDTKTTDVETPNVPDTDTITPVATDNTITPVATDNTTPVATDNTTIPVATSDTIIPVATDNTITPVATDNMSNETPPKKGGRKSRRNTKQYTSKKRQYKKKYTQYRRLAKTIKRHHHHKK